MLEVYRRYRPRRDWRVLLGRRHAGKRAAQDLAYRRRARATWSSPSTPTPRSRPIGILHHRRGCSRYRKVGAVTGNV